MSSLLTSASFFGDLSPYRAHRPLRDAIDSYLVIFFLSSLSELLSPFHFLQPKGFKVTVHSDFISAQRSHHLS